MRTWPLGFIRVTQIFGGSHEHLSVSHRRPERHHVVAPVVTDGGIFVRIHGRICRGTLEVSRKAYKKPARCAGIIKALKTWAVSPQPFIKYSVGVGVQQHEDGVVWREVSLSSCAVQEQMRQVVEAPHRGVVVALWGAVA